MVLTSTAPYDTSTHSVTVAETDFTIPVFPKTSPAGNCGLATNTVNLRYAGSVGNVMTLSLHGTLPEPPPPGTPTTTDLTVTTPGPVLVGTSVAMHATVRKTAGGGVATAAAGSMKFFSGTTQQSPRSQLTLLPGSLCSARQAETARQTFAGSRLSTNSATSKNA